MTGRGGRWLFGAAILSSAFLIFLVQPMVGKRVLPWFGGAPAVWTVCLTFYQLTLFVGYAYAHALIRFCPSALQLVVHGLLCSVAVWTLPVLPEAQRHLGGSESATAGILATLAVDVAPSFLFLAATGPLMQAWFARAHPGRSPYFLYAVSNLGSLAALLLYPFALEPRFGLADTGAAWSMGFAVAAAAILACAAISATRGPRETSAERDEAQRLRAGPVALWLFLSGTAVVLLMGVTNELCRDTLSVPFLWIAPLGFYLVSFIVCFAGERFYRPAPWLVIAIVAIPLRSLVEPAGNMEIGEFHQLMQTLPAGAALYGALLLAACMGLHGELYRIRPAVDSLTAFYLCVAAGGALGGMFVGILAERLFDDYHELPIGIALWLVLMAVCAGRDSRSAGRARGRLRWAVAALLAVGIASHLLEPTRNVGFEAIHQERSFFGVLRVLTNERTDKKSPQHQLVHGTTLHGVQFQHEIHRLRPSTYYGIATGIGSALGGPRDPSDSRRVGIVGLGAGTLAAYGRHGDLFRFYEIDPAVIRVAQDPNLFTFLADSDADIEVVAQDGRLALDAERQRGERPFDILVVDAFSGDSVPVHLLTREAFAIYRDRIEPQGLLAIHASSRHVDVARLAIRLGSAVGLYGAIVKNDFIPQRRSAIAVWVLMSPSPERIRSLADVVDRRRRAMGVKAGRIYVQRLDAERLERVPLWTDDYSDLLGALRVFGS